jgi:uncharacterized protein (TIGR02284 family)
MERLTKMETETIDGLKELIAYNLDSVEVLEAAASRVENAPVADLFRQIVSERRRQARELEGFVSLNAEEVKDKEKGTTGGSIRKVWVDFRTALNSGDTYVVLIEAERAEDRIVGEYKSILKKTAGSPVNDVLMRQFRDVKGWHDRVRQLRDACKKSSS